MWREREREREREKQIKIKCKLGQLAPYIKCTRRQQIPYLYSKTCPQDRAHTTPWGFPS